MPRPPPVANGKKNLRIIVEQSHNDKWTAPLKPFRYAHQLYYLFIAAWAFCGHRKTEWGREERKIRKDKSDRNVIERK